MAEALSKASEYEQMFGTRERRPGRPVGSVETFKAEGVDPGLVEQAKQRAYAVIHEKHKPEMKEIFHSELRVLRRREQQADAARALAERDQREAARPRRREAVA